MGQRPSGGMHCCSGCSLFMSIVYLCLLVSQSNEAIMKYFTVSLQFLLEFQVCYLNHLARYNYQSASLQRENVLVGKYFKLYM